MLRREKNLIESNKFDWYFDFDLFFDNSIIRLTYYYLFDLVIKFIKLSDIELTKISFQQIIRFLFTSKICLFLYSWFVWDISTWYNAIYLSELVVIDIYLNPFLINLKYCKEQGEAAAYIYRYLNQINIYVKRIKFSYCDSMNHWNQILLLFQINI